MSKITKGRREKRAHSLSWVFVCSLVVVHAALHLRVGLDAPNKVTGRVQQRRVEVAHRSQEGLGDGRPHQTLLLVRAAAQPARTGGGGEGNRCCDRFKQSINGGGNTFRSISGIFEAENDIAV